MTTFVLLFFFFLLFETLYIRIGNRFSLTDKPNHRSSHQGEIVQSGGILFYLAIWCYAVIFKIDYHGFLIGLSLISLISLIDDFRPLKVSTRLLFHIVAVALLFYEWNIWDAPAWILLCALIIGVGVVNAYNFMDGINGMTGGYSLVVLLSLTYLNHQLGFVDPNFLGVMLSAIFVFNIFNFQKDAKCFAGDVGAISIAFITLFLVGRLIIATQDITYLLLLAVYGVDTGLTILHRLRLGERITEPHRKHLYQILVNEMNLSHVGISSLYMGLQLSVSVGLVLCENEKWAYSFCCLGILGIGYGIIHIRNKIRIL